MMLHLLTSRMAATKHMQGCWYRTGITLSWIPCGLQKGEENNWQTIQSSQLPFHLRMCPSWTRWCSQSLQVTLAVSTQWCLWKPFTPTCSSITISSMIAENVRMPVWRRDLFIIRFLWFFDDKGTQVTKKAEANNPFTITKGLFICA